VAVRKRVRNGSPAGPEKVPPIKSGKAKIPVRGGLGLRQAKTYRVSIVPTGERPPILDQLELLRTRLVAAAAEDALRQQVVPMQK
jgi:hypothetical protein